MNDVSSLRNLIDQVEGSVWNLKSLKVDPSSYGILLVPLIKEKLPTEMRLLIARKFDNELWDLSEMLGVLKHEVEAKEHSVSVGVSSFESHGRKVNKESYSTCALNSYLQRGNKNKKVCVFCNSKQYPPWRCSKYTNLSYKREFLKRMLYLFWKRVHF